MSKETRMSINLQELNTLNDWLTRINYAVDSVELRQGFEPGIGQAITAYVETDNDEGYFRLLTDNDAPKFSVQASTQEAINLMAAKSKEVNV